MLPIGCYICLIGQCFADYLLENCWGLPCRLTAYNQHTGDSPRRLNHTELICTLFDKRSSLITSEPCQIAVNSFKELIFKFCIYLVDQVLVHTLHGAAYRLVLDSVSSVFWASWLPDLQLFPSLAINFHITSFTLLSTKPMFKKCLSDK